MTHAGTKLGVCRPKNLKKSEILSLSNFDISTECRPIPTIKKPKCSDLWGLQSTVVILGLRTHRGQNRPKNGQKWHFWGPVSQTGSINMAATQQNDFLTPVSYSTLNTFGGLSRTVKALPSWTLPLAHCKWSQNRENITSPAFWKFEIPYLGQMERDSLRIKTVCVSVLRPIICSGKIWVIPPERGQTQKVPRPQKFSTPQFWGSLWSGSSQPFTHRATWYRLSECTKKCRPKYRR